MKKTIFDFKLMKEGMRQVKSLAIGCLALQLIVFALIVPVQGVEYSKSMGGYQFIAQSAANLMPLLPMVCIVWAPLLCLALFSFLNNRGASDFYHALPQSRRCLFFSFLAAVGCWLFIIFFTVVLLTGLGTLLFPTLFHINWGEFLLYGIILWVCAFYVSAATLFALSVSGTTLTGILLTLLVVLGPRLAFMSLAEITTYASSIYTVEYLPFPFHANVNVVSSLTQLFTGRVNIEAWFRAESILFTLCLGIIYTLLGAHCFRKRKSESAGQPLPSGKASLLLPLAMGLIPCLFALRPLFYLIIDQLSADASLLATSLGCLLLGSALYLAFVWFAGRKPSAVKKALPGLLLLPLIMGLALGGMFLTRNRILHYRPAAEELDYVRILSVNMGRDESYANRFDSLHWNSKSYAAYDSIRLEDPAVLARLSRALTDTLDGKRDDNKNYHVLTVALKGKGSERVRTILLPEEDNTLVWNTLKQTAAYRQRLQNLPEIDTPGLRLTGAFGHSPEDYAALQKLYMCLREEVASMDTDTWLRDLTEQDRTLEPLQLSLSRNGMNESITLPISLRMPRTATLYFKEKDARTNRAESLQLARDLINRTGDPKLHISLNIFEKDGTWGDFILITTNPEAWLKESYWDHDALYSPDQGRILLDELQKLESPDPGKILIHVQMYDEGYSGTYWHNHSFWCSADTLPAFLKERKEAYVFRDNCILITNVLEIAMYKPKNTAEINKLLREYGWGESFESLQGMPDGAVYTYEDGVFSASYTDASGQVHSYEYIYGTEPVYY